MDELSDEAVMTTILEILTMAESSTKPESAQEFEHLFVQLLFKEKFQAQKSICCDSSVHSGLDVPRVIVNVNQSAANIKAEVNQSEVGNNENSQSLDLVAGCSSGLSGEIQSGTSQAEDKFIVREVAALQKVGIEVSTQTEPVDFIQLPVVPFVGELEVENYTPLPYLSTKQSYDNAKALVARLKADEEVWFEIYGIQGCFNCGDPNHQSAGCEFKRGTFCGGCGTSGVTGGHCPRCHYQYWDLSPPLRYVGYGAHRRDFW